MTGISKVKYTNQEIQNMGFDDELKIPVREIISKDGALINPATEEKQDDIIAAIGGLNYDSIEVDTTGTDIIVTRKLSGVTVSTKTITII